MPRSGFEPATPATKRPQTYALDRAATEVGLQYIKKKKKKQSRYTPWRRLGGVDI
jgi:hypothetical protein